MRVLVTGATGFLGSAVTKQLLHDGHTVRVLVRRPERLRSLTRRDLEIVGGDVLRRDSIAAAAANMDAVVHCAGMVSWRPRDRDEVERVNVEGTRNVVDVVAELKLRLLHTSSISTLGGTRRPRTLDETSAPLPLDFDDPYTESKRESERIALGLAARGGHVVVLQPGVLFGPGDTYFTSTQLVLHYLRGEMFYHLPGGSSYCDVRDVAAAYVRALNDGRPGERYLLAGVNRTQRELRAELRRLTGLQPSFPLAPAVAEWAAYWSETAARFAPHPLDELSRAVVRWGTMFAYCSVAKAERELGYHLRPFRHTLRDTIVDHVWRRAARAETPRMRRLVRTMAESDR